MRHLTRFGAGIILFVLAGLAPAAATQWPRSDIPPDPAVKFGVLGNGMRYAILRNHTPAGAVSVRFSIDAGSMQEAPDQRGLAHFVEHLAFRGSANFPDGEIDKSLQRLGLAFGSDTNASTGLTQTTYWFDLPRADDQSVTAALAISRDIAGNLDLSPAAAATESGVILSELKLRDVPSYRAVVSQLKFELVDPHATAMPGGDPAIVGAAPIQRIRDFYNAFYRPDRAVLVVVGDIDPAKVESLIRAQFAGWQNRTAAGADPVISVPLSRGLETRLYTETGAPSVMSLVWPQPLDAKPTDRAHWRTLHLQGVALTILNRRLQQLAASPQHPFQAARASRGEADRAAELVSLSISYEPGNWQRALAAAELVRLGALRGGVTQAEVDRVLVEQHAAHLNAGLAADTRSTSGLANELVGEAGDGDIFTNPAQELASSDEDLKGLTADTVTATLKSLFASPGPLLFVSASQPIEGGEAAIGAAFLDSEKAAAAAPLTAAAAQTSWPYADFGPAGTVAETRPIPDLGVTFVRFANGVRLALRPSRLRANQVLISVKVGNGRLDLPKDQVSAAWLAGALVQGGLKAISYTDMQQALSGKSWRAIFGVGEDGLLFSGGTTPQDIDTQLQVLAAYLREPGFRPEAFDQFKSASLTRRRQSDAVPAGVLQREAQQILHAGDKRWATPTIEQMQSGTVDDVRALLAPAFADGAIDITITGDIDAGKAIQAVAATFGALPPRSQSRAQVSAANSTHFPAGMPAPIKLETPTPNGQAIVTISWPTHGRFPDLRDDATLQLLGEIMQDKLFAQLRGLGTVYVAQVGAASSKVFDYGYLQASSQLQPGEVGKFNEALDQITGRMKTDGPTPDELERARTPALQELERSQQTNDYWLSVLDGAQEDQSRLDLARNYAQALKAVTPAQIIAAARKYLTPQNAIRLAVGAD